MGQLLQCWHCRQGVSGARWLYRRAVARVAAFQTQGQAAQRRDLATLAFLPVLRARTPDPAWARRVVGDGVMFCPRAGCGKSACPVRWAGCGDGVTVEPVRHRQTKGPAT